MSRSGESGRPASSPADAASASESAPPETRLWLAYLSGAFGLAATAQINFLVPLRARELGASFDVIGVIVGLGAAAPALLSVTSGAAIDRVGARRAYVLGTAATAGIGALFLLVTNYWWFLALQPALGIARNVGWLASQTHITGLGTVEQRHTVTGRFAFFTNGGQMVAPALIGAVAQFVGFRWAFGFFAAYAAAFALLGLLLPPSATAEAPARGGPRGLGVRTAVELLALRPVQAVLLLSGVRLWVTWIYMAFVPVYLVDSGLQPATVGTVIATSGLVATLAAPTTAFWTRFISPPSVATLGLGCGALALLLAPHLASVPLVYLVPALVGMGHGVSLPVLLTIMTAAASPGRRGVALGLRAAANQSTAAAGPMVIGAFISAAGIVLGFTAGALIAGGMLVGARLLHPRPAADRPRAGAGPTAPR